MKHEIPEDLTGAWVTGKKEIIEANIKAKKENQNAFSDEELLHTLIEDKADILVIPILKNAPLDSTNHYYRCMVWFKTNGKNKRLSTLMDIHSSDITSFTRPTERVLHAITTMLLEQIEQVNLNDYIERT